MSPEDQKAKWVDEHGYLYPMQVLRAAGCAAFGQDEVGIYIDYQSSAVDLNVRTLRFRLSAEHALELAAQLRFYADQPRSPPHRRDKKSK